MRMLKIDREHDGVAAAQVHFLLRDNPVQLLEIVLACGTLSLPHVSQLGEEKRVENVSVVMGVAR